MLMVSRYLPSDREEKLSAESAARRQIQGGRVASPLWRGVGSAGPALLSGFTPCWKRPCAEGSYLVSGDKIQNNAQRSYSDGGH